MLNEGTWSGSRVIDASYIRQAVTGTTANPGYGFLFWLNEGERYKTASLPEAHVTDYRFFPGSPTDTYSFVGALGQLIIVIPSRDIVIIRNGLPNKLDLEHPTEGFSAEFNREFKDIPRQVVLAVTDVPPVSPADSPYNHEPPGGIPDPASLGTLFDPALVLASLLGVGPNAGCNLLQCGTSSIVEQLAYVGGDTLTQVFNALLGSLTG
jgi:CubicO group peptidase (beta-lactamase class C family)